jgi:hypothetical protein
MSSKAANFRFTCGCERGAPECSSQHVPIGTPHVGQGTEDACSDVGSLFFILDRMRLQALANLYSFGHCFAYVEEIPNNGLAELVDRAVKSRQTAIADKWNLSRNLAGHLDENATNRPPAWFFAELAVYIGFYGAPPEDRPPTVCDGSEVCQCCSRVGA